MTFIEVMLATILGQLILAAVLGIIKGFTNALRERQKKKLNKSANDLLTGVFVESSGLSGLSGLSGISVPFSVHFAYTVVFDVSVTLVTAFVSSLSEYQPSNV